MRTRTIFRHPLLLSACIAGLFACATTPDRETPKPRSVRFVVFGDTGYTYDFLARKEYDPPLNREEFVAAARKKWISDSLPPEDFTPPALHLLERTGGYVAASGLGPVSRGMQRYCGQAQCAFGTLLGDNIYPDGATVGADGVSDADRFQKLFVQPLGRLGGDRKDFAIYVALGNHDWRTSREGAMAQVHFHEQTRPFYMDGIVYRVTPPAANGLVELFVIDTEVLLSRVTVYEDKLTADGTEIETDEIVAPRKWTVPQNELERGMQQWLEAALRDSKAPWKIVMAHHPLWSSSGGKFQQARTLRRLLLPTLCRYADRYLAGHEHKLELQLDDCSTTDAPPRSAPLLNVVSGADAKERPIHKPFAKAQQVKYTQLKTIWAKGMIWGFSHITLEGDNATVRMFTVGSNSDSVPVEEYTYEYRRNAQAVK